MCVRAIGRLPRRERWSRSTLVSVSKTPDIRVILQSKRKGAHPLQWESVFDRLTIILLGPWAHELQ